MEIDIKELASTLAIGAYILFGFEFILRAAFSTGIFSRVFGRRFTNDAVRNAIIVALCFAAGMMAEDMADLVTKEPWTFGRSFGNFDMIREKSLFSFDDVTDLNQVVFNAPCRPFRIDSNSLATQAARLGLFTMFGGVTGRDVERKILRGDAACVDARTRTAAQQFYYHAKNIVFLRPQYYDELKKIDQRMTFSRSFALASFTFLLLVLVILAFKTAMYALHLLLRELPRRVDPGASGSARISARARRRVLGICQTLFAVRTRRGILLLIVLFLVLAWKTGVFLSISEERAFNRRAYGYFISTIVYERAFPTTRDNADDRDQAISVTSLPDIGISSR